MAEFNLIEKSWIPCIDLHDHQVEYGIRDVLVKAHELGEICDDSPLATLAIHRLLLAVLYRGLSGPTGFPSWKKLYAKGAFDSKMIGKYLDRWKTKFDLLSNTHPFYQMGEFKTKKAVSLNRLATECASGNNATLFDHCGDVGEVEWSFAKSAKQLTACQSFALGFGKSGDAVIKGIKEALPYSADAIALRGMSVWLQGRNLFETLMINLVPIEESSPPPWELENSHEYRDRLCGKERKVFPSKGAVDCFTWQSRLVKFVPNDSNISWMYFGQGRSADKSACDPMKVYRFSRELGISALPIGSGRAAWRDAHSILMIPLPDGGERRPECFNLVRRARADADLAVSSSFITQIVGLASAPNKAGKFLLWRHERIPLPAPIISDDNLIGRLGGLLKNAEQSAGELNHRTRRIAKLYLSPDAESPGGRQPDKDEVTKVVEAIDPRPIYWARLEGHFLRLVAGLPDDWDNDNEQFKPDDQQQATNQWRMDVKHEAKRALEESIRSLGNTARAIQAVARVSTGFTDADLQPPAEKAAASKGTGKGGKKKNES